MATSLDQTNLLEESHSVEDPFESLIDGDYEELKGRATATFMPLEKGEILLREGEAVQVRLCSLVLLDTRVGEVKYCCHFASL